jgi:aspartate racemase
VKTMGVLGGIGPQATIDFESRVHRESQRLIPQRFNGGYPPMVVYYCRHPPFFVTETGVAEQPLRPDPRLLDAARRLGSLADFLAIPCNGAHNVQAEIEEASGLKVVSIIDATLAEVRRRNWKRVGVLGFGNPVVYTRPLEKMGLAFETLDADARAPLDGAIMKLIEGRDNAESTAVACRAVDTLRDRDVDGVILGCTEIPLLLHNPDNEPDLINPTQYLAIAAVRAAME